MSTFLSDQYGSLIKAEIELNVSDGINSKIKVKLDLESNNNYKFKEAIQQLFSNNESNSFYFFEID